MVYVDLRAAIQQYCENFEDSFAERIDTFILQAENRIAHLVRLPPHRKLTTATFSAGDRIIAPPADFLSPDSLFVLDSTGQWHPMFDKEPEFIRVCYPGAAMRGRPLYYAKIDATSMLLGPTPDQDYPAEMQYFAYPPSIRLTGRSWLGDHAESLLLSGCLLEAYTFMKGEADLLQWYDKRFSEAVALYKQLGDGRARKDSLEEPDRRVEV